MSYYTRNTFSAIPWTNDFDQLLNPGDPVIVVSTGYSHSVHVRTGTFAGVYLNKKGEVVSVSVDNLKDRRYSYKTREYEDVFEKRAFPNKRVYKLA